MLLQVLDTLRRVEAEKFEEAEAAYREEESWLAAAKAKLLKDLAVVKPSRRVVKGIDKVTFLLEGRAMLEIYNRLLPRGILLVPRVPLV
jgi:hypothetical protein